MFKAGMKCKIVDPFYSNYEKGKIVTLEGKRIESFTTHPKAQNPKGSGKFYYWIIVGGGTGVCEKEMTPLKVDWKERLSK